MLIFLIHVNMKKEKCCRPWTVFCFFILLEIAAHVSSFRIIESPFRKSRIDHPLGCQKQPWYSDSNLSRSWSQPNRTNAKYLISQWNKGIVHLSERSGVGPIQSLFLSHSQLLNFVGNEMLDGVFNENGLKNDNDGMLVWIGEHSSVQYWILNLPDNYVPVNVVKEMEVNSSALLLEGISKVTEISRSESFYPDICSLREFGDRIPTSHEAAIHATANGILEFHRAYRYCSFCGSHTRIQKAGASRLCINHISQGGSCQSRSCYPRIDIASIMLITSPCGNYALLGRKKQWPKGRYSTLAGFLEVGETLTDCCIRETFEESGVAVEKESVEFVQSQPWPFPRSMMVGFRGRARNSNLTTKSLEVYNEEEAKLPEITVDKKEMEDIRWFHKEFVAKNIKGGSTALSYEPTKEERVFHIPGKSSLARMLIMQWVGE